MHELQQLNRELDVSDAAARPFEIGGRCRLLGLVLEKADAAQGIHVETLTGRAEEEARIDVECRTVERGGREG